MYYGEEAGISTGASSDLRHATYTAENMIISYGMDEEFGLAVMDSDAATSSEKLRERVNEVLDDEMKKAVEIIHDNKQWVDVLVDALLEKNRLKSNEIEDLLGKNLCPANKDS